MPIYGYRCSSCGYESEVLQTNYVDVYCCKKQMERKMFAPMVKIKGEGGYPSRRKQIFNTTMRIHPKLDE